MWKILWQISPTKHTTTVVYTCPPNTNTHVYTIMINSFRNMWKSVGSSDRQYKLHIVKSGNPLDWSEDDVLLYYQTRADNTMPDIYKDITLDEWDSIVMYSKIDWLSIQVFWEEQEFDFDDLITTLRSINTSIQTLNTTRQSFPACTT